MLNGIGGDHVLTWALFRFVTWAGTVIADALLVGFMGLFIPMGLWGGLLLGGVYSGMERVAEIIIASHRP